MIVKSRILLARFVTGPVFLGLLNLLTAFLIVSAIRYFVAQGHSIETHHDLIYTWEGVGTILVGLGVALEERGTLRGIFGLPLRDPLEKLCHDYGVMLVFGGVVIEIFAWIVKIPNEVFNTSGAEFAAFSVCAVIGVFVLYCQLRFVWGLIRVRRDG